jgi:hypothetical protein
MNWNKVMEALRNPVAFLRGSSSRKETDASEEGFVAFVRDLYEKADEDRRLVEGEWWENLAMVSGEHYVRWDSKSRQLRDVPLKRQATVRHTANLTAPATLRDIAKVTKRSPKLEVTPSGMDQAAERRARFTQRAIDATFQLHKMALKWGQWMLWARIASKAYMYVLWDSAAGAVVEGKPIGDVFLKVLEPFQVYHDPGVDDLEESSWVMVVHQATLGYIADNWPDQFDDIRASAEKCNTGGAAAKLKADLSGQARGSQEDSVRVTELWLRPNPAGKTDWERTGLYAAVAGSVLVRPPEKFPYDHGQLPVVQMRDGYLSGLGSYGPTVIKQLRPTQHGYNRMWSKKIMNSAVAGAPAYLVPRGCNVPEGAITGEPGELIPCDVDERGLAPTPLRVYETHPTTFDRMSQQFLTDFDNISGQHEVSRGVLPSANISGVAIDLLQEQDDTMLGPAVLHLETAIEEVARLVVKLFEQFLTEPRQFLYYGENGTYRFKAGKDDLKYQSIRTVPGSMRPVSRAALQAQILTFFEKGLFGPFETPEHERVAKQVLDMLEFGSLDESFQTTKLDRYRAEAENDLMDEGQAENTVEVNAERFDDHKEHIKIHTNRQKLPGYSKLPAFVKQQYEDHIDAHMGHMAEDQNIEPQRMTQQVQQLVQAQDQQGQVPAEAMGELPAVGDIQPGADTMPEEAQLLPNE